MISIRYLYATAAHVERDKPWFMTKVQVLTFLATDEDEARAHTLAYCEHQWPAAKGWRHQVSVVRIVENLIDGHGTMSPPPTWEEET